MKWYWHIHHDCLIERTYVPIKGRIAFIKNNKPAEQVPLRLALLKPVRTKLPKLILDFLNYNYALTISQRADARKKLLTIHKKECPGCTFSLSTRLNGTIFPHGWQKSKRNQAAVKAYSKHKH